MSYDDTFRADMSATIAGILSDLQADGIVMAENVVALVVETRAAANRNRGNPGTVTDTQPKVLDPRPTVDLRTQIRHVDGAPQRVGDALLTISREACTMAELLAASYITIDGERYTIVQGHIKVKPFFYHVVVNRTAQPATT